MATFFSLCEGILITDIQAWVSVIGVLVMISIALYQRRNSLSDKIWSKLDLKVDKENCQSFRTRIGKESDDHRIHIDGMKQDITEIKEGIAYLKGKSNG